MNQQGWTLIELVLVILLMGFLSTLVLTTRTSTDHFDHYLTQQTLLHSLQKAQSRLLLSDESIRLSVAEEVLVFEVIGKESSSWEVNHINRLAYDETLFPLLLEPNRLDSIKVEFTLNTKRIVFEPEHGITRIEYDH